MASGKRDHLIDTALGLFSRYGYHAMGIDRILAESGVAKMTLYNHFKSKDELILAVLRRRDERFRNWFMRTVERRAKAPLMSAMRGSSLVKSRNRVGRIPPQAGKCLRATVCPSSPEIFNRLSATACW